MSSRARWKLLRRAFGEPSTTIFLRYYRISSNAIRVQLEPRLIETGPASSSHDRLLEAAKILFAVKGYENTSTSSIARLAGTSESQLIKHFGSKEGLLTAVFDHGWARIAQHLDQLKALPTAEVRLSTMLEVVLAALERDAYLCDVLLLEGRRIRSHGRMVLLTTGYLRLIDAVDTEIEQLRREGKLRSEVSPQAVRSALVGMLESMVRDIVLARRIDFPADFDLSQLKQAFQIVLKAFVPDAETEVAPQPSRKAKSRR